MWIGLSFFGFLIGTILGSFAKAVADRLNKQDSLRGRSYCVKCKHILAWYDLFPVFSYIMLLGKCRYCRKSIPFTNLAAELVMGFLVAGLFLTQAFDFNILLNPTVQSIPLILNFIFKIFIVLVLFILFLTDIKTGLLPDKVTYPAVGIAIGYWLVACGLNSWLFYLSLKSNFLGKYLMPPYSNYFWTLIYRIWEPAIFSIIIGIVSALFFAFLIIITKGRGMGWGDVKYVLFLGIALGFPNAIIGLFLAFLIGAVFSVILMGFGKKHFGQTIPFGPFLSLGAYIALLWGPQILNWYLNSFKLGY
ncbi:MAG: prepilin peptidase [Candidatus Daviesbacteria bacterium]|nr:prepilin peptidase [Candidatus Daviesbacteria bacterium]